MNFRNLALGTLAATALALPASALSLSERFTSFSVFGDSLSDPGNLFDLTGGTNPPAPYFDGRFSNGPVWAERFTDEAAAAGIPSLNVAFGGARAADGSPVPNFEQQLGLAAPALPLAGSNAAAAVWFGGNDVIAAVGQANLATIVQDAANAVADGVEQLGQAGVSNVFLFNVPDLGSAPIFALFQPALAAQATLATNIFNDTLQSRIAGLRASGIRIVPVDVDAAFSALLDDPSTFGVSDTTLPCLFPDAGTAAFFGQNQVCSPDQSLERAFFDGLHPNASVHAGIADIFDAQVAAVPLPAAGWLLLVGFGGLAAMRRRR